MPSQAYPKDDTAGQSRRVSFPRPEHDSAGGLTGGGATNSPGHAAPRVHADASGKRSVVIGAGFAGIAVALRLAAQGARVTLVDRLPDLGGRARTFRSDGFTFDAGPTVITAPYLLDELFNLFGESMSDHVELRPVTPWYRVQWGDGATFDYGGGVDQMCEQIARFNPADQDGYRRMLGRAEEIYRIGYEQLGDQPFDSLSTMVKAVPDMLRLGAQRSMYSFVASHLRNERLRQVFTFQPLLVGGNPFTTSCIYALIQPLEQRFGVHYAMGGTTAIIEALGGLLERAGVTVLLGDAVSSVETRDDRVTSVVLDSGRSVPCDLAVSAGDPVRLYSDLLSGRRHGPSALRAKTMKLSMGLFVSYFGTDTTYPDLAHHTILLSDRYKELLTDIFDRGIVPDDPSLYVHAPTRSDPSMAPPSKECFYALAPVPNLKLFSDWSSRADALHDTVLGRIEDHMAPGLRGNLATKFAVTPEYFQNELDSPAGAGFSVQPVLSQSAYFRFHNRCPHYANLYLAGAGTHPGAGIPGTLCTAKTTMRCIARDGILARSEAV
ncbi:MAG: phytoene desaturase family protein [Planctomycetota bacterium]